MQWLQATESSAFLLSGGSKFTFIFPYWYISNFVRTVGTGKTVLA